jgi:hypothetical protein
VSDEAELTRLLKGLRPLSDSVGQAMAELGEQFRRTVAAMLVVWVAYEGGDAYVSTGHDGVSRVRVRSR